MKSVLQMTHTLNNGVKIPVIGFGTFMMSDPETALAVRQALETGYRLIDTAAFYNCEKGVGQGIRDSGIPREEIFVTTKVWPTNLYHNRTEESYEESLQRLGLEYIDLFLVHWPVNYVNAWKVMEKIYRQGRVRAIGISNFRIRHLLTLFDTLEIVPALNQLEINPLINQYEIRSFCEAKGIAVGAWQPLGSGSMGGLLTNEVIAGLAQMHGKSPAQIALRWSFQNNIIAVPKTVSPQRMKENADILDFELTKEDMELLGELMQLPRYDTEIDDIPLRIKNMIQKGICFKEEGYQGNKSKNFYG